MNAIPQVPSPADRVLAEQFHALREGLGDTLAVRARDVAFSDFAARGLPHRRVESWHYTDLRSMIREPWSPAAPPDEAILAEALTAVDGLADPGARIVLVDGRFAPSLSSVEGLGARVNVRPIGEALSIEAAGASLGAAEALGRAEAVVALNGAMLQGGVAVSVEPGTKVDAPISIISVASGRAPAAVYARCYVELGAHASATLVERFVALGDAAAQGNHVTVLAVGDGATLDHVAVLDGLGANTLHVGTTLARLGADARLLALTLTASPGITRRQAFLEFTGAGSLAHFRGVALLGRRAHADTTLVVTHTAPGCESRELYKHVLDDEATGVFQGKVIVAAGAQKSDGKMLSKAVFLKEGASMFNKPELEIFADDVVCGHGATVGALDEDQLFYLRARGIPLAEAQAMLLEAFAAEAIEGVGTEEIAAEMTGRVSRWLRQHAR